MSGWENSMEQCGAVAILGLQSGGPSTCTSALPPGKSRKGMTPVSIHPGKPSVSSEESTFSFFVFFGPSKW